MGCIKCGASKMTLKQERNFLNVYLIRNYSCPRCQATTKELKALCTGDTRLTLASSMPVPPSKVIR
jgi:predicted nucleic-acid-binding Zn-ribbon protein